MQSFAHLRRLSHLIPLVTRLEEQEKELWQEVRKLKDGVFNKKWETRLMEKEYTEKKSEEKRMKKEEEEKEAIEDEELVRLFEDDINF